MKVCPDCGYSNPDKWAECEICKRSLADVCSKNTPTPAVCKRTGYGIKVGLVCLALVVVSTGVYFLVKHLGTSKAVAEQPQLPTLPKTRGAGADMSLETLRSVSELSLPGEDEVKLAVSKLSASDSEVRIEALQTVGAWIGDGVDYLPAPWEKLLVAASDPEADVRAEAAFVMGLAAERTRASGKLVPDAKVKKQAETVALKLLAEPYENVRESASFMIGSFRMAGIESVLLSHIRQDQDISVRMSAAGALVKLGNPEGTKYLVNSARDKDEEVRRMAAGYLGYSEKTEAEETLKQLLRDASPRVRSEAAQSLSYRKSGLAVKTGF